MMEKYQLTTGFCPKENKNINVPVIYVFNVDCWEKGISEPPCHFPCEDGCPIIESAPDEITHI